jgi:hypothetical protein
VGAPDFIKLVDVVANPAVLLVDFGNAYVEFGNPLQNSHR